MALFPYSFKTADGRELTIDFTSVEDFDEVSGFILEHFVTKPPIRQLNQYDEASGKSPSSPWLLEYVRECVIQPKTSLVARDPQGRLAAVRINKVEDRPVSGPDIHEYSEWNLITAYLAELYRDVDLFSLFDTDKIFNLAIISVSSEYTKQGLATELYKLSLQVAKDLGVEVVKTEAGSEYVAKAVKNLGFSTFKALDFASVEYNGTRPLANAPGMGDHKIARLMARRL